MVAATNSAGRWESAVFPQFNGVKWSRIGLPRTMESHTKVIVTAPDGVASVCCAAFKTAAALVADRAPA